MTAVDRSPSRFGALLALSAGGAAVLAPGSALGLVVGSVGLLVLLAGVLRASRSALLWGAGMVFGGVVLAGVRGAPPAGLLVGTAASVLAWDVGENAIDVGEQLGRDATTRRPELVHAASSTIVAAVAVAAGYAVYRVAAGGQPLAALVFLLVGAITLAAALRA